MSSLKEIFNFIQLTNDFQKVKRRVLIKDEQTWENDVEHSYQLAMVSWYIIITKKLPLHLDLTIKYALLHDFVEVYAGDTYIYDPDPEVLKSKTVREHDALQKLKSEFSESPDLWETISQYEKRKDEESKFVYALDKVLPMVNIYLDGGRTWRQEKVDLQMLVDNKLEKVALSPEIEKYFHEFVSMISKDQLSLFGKHSYEKI